MENNLRPLTLGEILDRTAELYRRNFLLFAGIFSVYAGVVLLLGLLQIGLAELLKSLHQTEHLQWLTLTATGLQYLLVFLCAGAALAAINRAVAWVNLGQSASIRAAYASILPRLGRYLWLMTITGFIAWWPTVLLYGGYLLTVFFYLPKGFLAHPNAVAASGVTPDSSSMLIFGLASIIFVLLLIPAIAYGVIMSLRYSLAVPASVVEETPARPSIRRSITLSQGARGRIFLLGLLVAVIKIGLAGLSQLFFVIFFFKHHGNVGPIALSLSQIVAFFTNSFLGPIYATGITLFYYDQRIRKEGFDIEQMMQAAGLTVPATLPAAAREAAHQVASEEIQA